MVKRKKSYDQTKNPFWENIAQKFRLLMILVIISHDHKFDKSSLGNYLQRPCETPFEICEHLTDTFLNLDMFSKGITI